MTNCNAVDRRTVNVEATVGVGVVSGDLAADLNSVDVQHPVSTKLACLVEKMKLAHLDWRVLIGLLKLDDSCRSTLSECTPSLLVVYTHQRPWSHPCCNHGKGESTPSEPGTARH